MLAYATQDGDVFISDPDGTDPVLISDGQFYSGWSPRWSSDGRFLLYSTDATYVVDPDGTIVLTTEGCCAAWSPDGNLVASAVYREDLDALTVVVTGIDGVIRTQLELHGHPNFLGSATKIYWTPDGRGVTLTGVEWPEGNCCEGLGAVIPIDGSAHYQLPVLPSAQASTVFSNGGSLLVGHGTRQMQGFSASLITTEPDTRQFLVAAVDRAASRPLVPEGRVVEGPWYPHVWSPDDRRVVASHDGGDGNLEQLFAIDVATGQLTLLAATPITQSEYIPLRASDWEAASDRIMFERGDDLWVVSSDGSDARPLVKGAYGGSWQPTP
jgi:Tol biopolymer transport system component